MRPGGVNDAAYATPRIQAFIPLYNDIAYFQRALDSLLSQKDVSLGVIVSDNASTDGSYEYALRIASEDSRVKVFRNDSNIGAIPNINLFSRYVTSEYYIILCSDDALGDVGALRKAQDVLDANHDVVAVYCDAIYIDGKDRQLGIRRYRPTGHFDGAKVTRNSVTSYRNCFGIPLLKRRSAYADLFYPETMTYVGDIYVDSLAATRGRVFHIAEPLIWNRYTGRNLTAKLVAQTSRQFSELGDALGVSLRWQDRMTRTVRLAMVLLQKYAFLYVARLRS
jgi:glycosyltransferase involved in cell wall biosynthesis